MPYVYRDEYGNVAAVYSEMIEDGMEMLPPEAPEVQEFLYRAHPEAAQQRQLIESDLALARVLEDLIDVLIDKGHIMFTDFPEAAQAKLLQRRGLRKEFSYVESLFGGDDGGGFDDGSGQGGSFL